MNQSQIATLIENSKGVVLDEIIEDVQKQLHAQDYHITNEELLAIIEALENPVVEE